MFRSSTFGFFALIACLGIAMPEESFARGGLGGYHSEGYHIGGVGVPYGGVSLGTAAAGGMHAGYGYGKTHYHPSIGYYHPSTEPYRYNLGAVGGYRYNQSYANPYAYHNPYMYKPYDNPLAIPYTHAF
ncbi:MAG: hypothetical protein CMJ77_10535 [Planctomycetaceae bacterium]|nr:hypothetical protein [Planctomycetaceae bacterium]